MKLCEWFYIAVTINKIIQEWRMALVELWILLWTFSVCCWKNILAHISLLLFFRRQRQKILHFLPWSIFTLEATKDSNTCVETIWWHYGGCARKRVASFRRYCTIFSDFFSFKKKVSSEEKRLWHLFKERNQNERHRLQHLQHFWQGYQNQKIYF